MDAVLIDCGRALLALVWNNPISNVIKFTGDGGTIPLTLKKEKDAGGVGGFVVMTPSDTGCGMSEETAARIFDTFYQGDSSHSVEGNGLGLALVKRVLALVGGEVSVDSRINAGTTFTVKRKA